MTTFLMSTIYLLSMFIFHVSAFTKVNPYLSGGLKVSTQQNFRYNSELNVVTAGAGERQSLYASNELSNIILFDGVCNFCNKWVDIMLQLDTGKKFKFCALQSPKGKELLQEIGKDANDISTVVLIKSLGKREAYYKSDAVLKVIEQLGLPLYAASAIGSTLPLFIRNGMYNEVAANRYNP